MKFDFFSVLKPIALTTEKAVEFIIHSSDRLVIDAITALIKGWFFFYSPSVLKFILKHLAGFIQSFISLIQGARTVAIQID